MIDRHTSNGTTLVCLGREDLFRHQAESDYVLTNLAVATSGSPMSWLSPLSWDSMAGGQQSSVLATKSHMASKNPIESAEDQTHVLPDRAQVKNSNRAQSPLSAKGQ